MERSYDSSLRVTQITVNGADPIAYSFDYDGLVTSAGALTTAREPETIEWSYDGTPIYSETFIYDKWGWITEKIRAETGASETLEYAYGAHDRLPSYGGTTYT